jgi:hypothetical protein
MQILEPSAGHAAANDRLHDCVWISVSGDWLSFPQDIAQNLAILGRVCYAIV